MDMCPCGVYCNACHMYQDCKGCHELEGKVFWANEYGSATCPIYECCKAKGYTHCGKCREVPCKIWWETRDPSITDDDQWATMIEIRKEVVQCLF